MGLFDSVAGQVLGALTQGAGGQHPAWADALGGLLQQHGGLQGLVEAFQKNGLGEIVGSWVGTGQNLPVSAEQLQQVLGSGQVQAIAQALGFDPQQALGHLAQALPQAIDTLTPGGHLPDAGALDGLLGLLRR